MATKSFITDDEASWALQNFRLPSFDQPIAKNSFGRPLSLWLGELLLEKLKNAPHFWESRPIFLGSGARFELSPKSDIDMIFCGPEELVQKTVGDLQSRGIRIRARVPEDLEDWTVGVEPFDVLAVLQGRALDFETQTKLKSQKELILKRRDYWAKKILAAIKNEKANRRLRFDSVANYLEPNIKYGPGGLRDLEQALAIRELFPTQFSDSDPAFQRLEHFKSLWLAIRQYLHLNGGGDLLTGNEQIEVAGAFGFEQLQDFMRQFQLGISEVNFSANWVIEKSTDTKSRKTRKLQSYSDALKFLKNDSSVLAQERVRESLSTLLPDQSLEREFNLQRKEEFFEALFDSHLIDQWIKDIQRLRGLVQHDHYHRFTADAHLLQAIREVCRAFKKKSSLGKLKRWAMNFSAADWQILLWTALFHDLAKGLGGDHSGKGAKICERELKKLGVSDLIVEEVRWMVENHLRLSTAAFRQNVQDPQTWLELYRSGAIGRRLERLAIFTALDIRATNPEAWNEWKERMLHDLILALESRVVEGLFTLLDQAPKSLEDDLVNYVDPVVIPSLPAKGLIKDIQKVRRVKGDLPPLAIRNRRGELWVRFHSYEDRPGLFLQYVAKIFAVGGSILQSSVRTTPTHSAYDWFHVKSQKTPAQVIKQFKLIQDWAEVSAPTVRLQKIEVIRHEGAELILSFRGKDQKGVLLATAKALFDLGLTIRWAKVVTWGSQIDDVFSVSGNIDLTKVLAFLEKQFV